MQHNQQINIMKIQLTFTDVNSGNEFIQTVQFENNCIMDLLTNETAIKIFAIETVIQKLTNSVIFLKEIKDID